MYIQVYLGIADEGEISIEFMIKNTTEIRTNGPPSNYIKHFPKLPSKAAFIPTEQSEVRRIHQWIVTLFNLDGMASSAGLDPILEVTKLIKGKLGIKNFDPRNLESINEMALVSQEVFVQKILPLQITYGYVYLTNKNLYFIAQQSDGQTALTKVRLRNITLIFKRRYVLKETSIEFFIKNEKESVYLNFQDEQTRNDFYTKIVQHVPEVTTEESIAKMTAQWQRKEISNYEYIIGLNRAAQRSFSDLSQYPVFPWTIIKWDIDTIDLEDESIYRDLSKPIGALNPERLAKYKERMRDLKEKPFLYGTHYSAPGYVIGYLLRNHPLYMLKLGGGRFDRSDRLFFSIMNDWKVLFSI